MALAWEILWTTKASGAKRIVDAWYHSPGMAEIPGGETLSAVRARGLSAVRELADRHEGHTIVLVGHTVINRLILLAERHMSFAFSLKAAIPHP